MLSLHEHDRLSINRKSGASKLVVVVECSPHEAKLPQSPIDSCACILLGHRHLPVVTV